MSGSLKPVANPVSEGILKPRDLARYFSSSLRIFSVVSSLGMNSTGFLGAGGRGGVGVVGRVFWLDLLICVLKPLICRCICLLTVFMRRSVTVAFLRAVLALGRCIRSVLMFCEAALC